MGDPLLRMTSLWAGWKDWRLFRQWGFGRPQGSSLRRFLKSSRTDTAILHSYPGVSAKADGAAEDQEGVGIVEDAVSVQVAQEQVDGIHGLQVDGDPQDC